MEFYQKSDKLTLVLLQSKTTGVDVEGDDNDEWKGFVQTIKKFLRLKLAPMDNKLTKVSNGIHELHHDMHNIMDRMDELKSDQADIRKDL